MSLPQMHQRCRTVDPKRGRSIARLGLQPWEGPQSQEGPGSDTANQTPAESPPDGP
ncbi:hypothetical protein HJFPF1_00555 [Paramyrothecium foliicola]|nr:hypothetical protein HJFPF1_00555 [Paramyrothecium foliicola]